MNTVLNIIENLECMSSAETNHWKSRAYEKAVNTIRETFNVDEVPTSDYKWESLMYVGSGIARKIRDQINCPYEVIVETTDRVPVTDTVHDVVKMFFKRHKETAGGDNNWCVAGSYRRRLPTVHDLDFVTTRSYEQVILLINFINNVSKMRVKVINNGKMRVRIAIQYKELNIEADIRVINKESWATGLLYLTGSKEHNIKMRALAKRKQLLLNEYGLWTDLGTRLDTNTEDDIFFCLGLDFVFPQYR